MRYSRHQREAFGEALFFISSGEALRHLLNVGAAEVRAGAAFGRNSYGPGMSRANAEIIGACLGLAIAACHVSVGMGLWVLARMSSRLFGKMRRPQYYPRERSRRERLARGRRRVRDRFTTGPCPEPGKLLEQYARARTGAHEALVFGSMLCDLEAHCDNSLLRNADGGISGRNPGVKGWLRDNCPGLLAHYKNAMRYKGLAERFRRAAGAADPVPAAALAAVDDGEFRRLLGGKRARRVTVRMRKANGVRGGRVVSATYELDAGALEEARGRAREILAECGGCAVNRSRCGTNAWKEQKEQQGAQVARGEALDRGEKVRNARWNAQEWRGNAREKGGRRGGVARLERILDERLDGMPGANLAPSRWRVGESSSRSSARANGGSKCASA